MSETTATGPVRSWRDDPQGAAMMAGINAAYNPKYTGRPESCTYAMALGTNTSPPVMPAIRSMRSTSVLMGNQRGKGKKRD